MTFQCRVDATRSTPTKPWGTAYRGFGHVEFFWGLERHMELVAESSGWTLGVPQEELLKPGSTTLTGERINEHTGNPSSASRRPPVRSTTAGSP